MFKQLNLYKMKTLIITLALVGILLSSCSNNSSNNKDTHVHDDGTKHSNHDHKTDETPKQEQFEVGNDTLKNGEENNHTHSHDGGHDHTH
jgi:hypothetical protein